MKKLFITLAVLAAAVAVVERLARKIEIRVVRDEDEEASSDDAEPGFARAAGLRYGVRSEAGLAVLSRLDERLKNLFNNPEADDTV
jgi:hypothetical protein